VRKNPKSDTAGEFIHAATKQVEHTFKVKLRSIAPG
jgi:hypothetical protein